MNSKPWLAVSLAANGVLAAVSLWLAVRLPLSNSGAIASSGSPGDTMDRSASREIKEGERAGAAPLAWRDSLATLRRSGVPSAILAKLVMEKVAEDWHAREAAYGEQYLHRMIDDKRLAEIQAERASFEERELRDALGDDYLAWDKERVLQGMLLGGLAPSTGQKDALYALHKQWLRRVQELEKAQREGQLDTARFDALYSGAESEYKTQFAKIVGTRGTCVLPSAEEPAVQVLREFGHLTLNERQTADLAVIQKAWSEARRDLAASMQQNHSVDTADAADLQIIDQTRDTALRRVLGEDAFRAWLGSLDTTCRALQSDVRSSAIDATRFARVSDVVREHRIAMASLRHDEQMREFYGLPLDYSAANRAQAGLTIQTAVKLRTLLGRDQFERMQHEGLFGIPDLDDALLTPPRG